MRKSERGQAVTETLLVSWIVLLFLGAAFQLFLANESIHRSVTAVHQRLFTQGFETNRGGGSNCDGKVGLCRYRYARVDWTRSDFPETRVPVVPLFQTPSTPGAVFLHRQDGGIKQTVLSAGTYYPIDRFDPTPPSP
jgi:hypothetical protein